MENQEQEKNKNSKALLYTIIGILVALNAGLLYMWKKGGNEKEKIQTQLVSTTNELKETEMILAEAELLLEKYRADSAAMAEKGKELGADLISRKNEITALTAKLRNSQTSVKEKEALIAQLRQKITEMEEEIAKLEKENAEVKEINAKLEEEKQEITAKYQEETVEKKKYKSIAQKLQTQSLTVEPMKKRWITGKEAVTYKAKDVESLKTSFTIAENTVAEPGEKIIYIKITGPEGVTLANPGNEGGTFEFENKESKYTYKVTTIFDQESKAVPASIWRPAGDLKPGKYTVELYSDGFKMGGSTFTLK